jgi:hypothetical protein
VRAAIVVLVAAVIGCGGGWTDADTNSSTNAVRAQLAIEAMCVDGGSCVPAQVRSLERMAYCSNASMLVRHADLTLPDGGISCQAR